MPSIPFSRWGEEFPEHKRVRAASGVDDFGRLFDVISNDIKELAKTVNEVGSSQPEI
jgi:hypothetical protein